MVACCCRRWPSMGQAGGKQTLMELSSARDHGGHAGHARVDATVLSKRGQEGKCLPPSVERKAETFWRARWLGTPKLVRETSRRHWWQRSAPEKSVEDVKRDFSDIVLPPALQARCAAVAGVLCGVRGSQPLDWGLPAAASTMPLRRPTSVSALMQECLAAL